MTMTVKEASEKLGYTLSHVRKLIKEGQFTPVNKRPRGAKRFRALLDAVEVELFMAKRDGETKKKLVPLPKMPRIKKEPETLVSLMREMSKKLEKIAAALGV
jgi:excisionase family DNA binding protein